MKFGGVCFNNIKLKKNVRGSHKTQFRDHLTHENSHITRAVEAMDRCFRLVRPHQHGVAGTNKELESYCYWRPLLLKRMQGTPDEAEIAAHGCHCLGDMALRMSEMMATPRSCVL